MTTARVPADEDGAALADALRRGGPAAIEVRRARARAKALLFGTRHEGTKVDRYFLIALVGSGGMGVVYAAYDPALDRKVALKLLHAPPAAQHEERGGHYGLVAEARALARVTHPNVVQVYDAGLAGDVVFLTMELIAGENLRSWLSPSQQRPWRQIVEMLVQAGRGLASVHKAGLIHRDFKPENVLIGPDAVPRVVDFGVAGARDTVKRAEPDPLGGTRAYMAPEHLEGRSADTRSDIYSFCVTLFEALHGHRPGERTRTKRRDAQLPAWLSRCLARGLSPDPLVRPRTMDKLLAQLERGLRGHRSFRTLVVVLAVGSGLGMGLATFHDTDRCGAAAADLAAPWDAQLREQITAALAVDGAGYSETEVQTVLGRLDNYVEEWNRQRVEVCEDHRRGPQSVNIVDLRGVCLDRAATQFSAVVHALAVGEPGSALRAVDAVSRLPRLQHCADTSVLLAPLRPPPAPGAAAKVEVLRRELDSAEARSRVGDPQAALTGMEAVLREAEAIGYRPLLAEVLHLRGVVLVALGRYDEAAASHERAFFDARASGHDALSFRAAQHLVNVFALGKLDFDKAAGWLRHATAELERIGRRGHDAVALLQARGTLAMRRGRYTLALRHHRDGLELAQSDRDISPESVAILAHEVGVDLDSLGRYSEAIPYYERSRRILARVYGPAHPELLPALGNLALDSADIGRVDDGVRYATEALGIARASLDPDHPMLIDIHQNMAVTLEHAGDHSGATVHLRAALELAVRVRGPAAPDLARLWSNLGQLAEAEGRYEPAIEAHARAVEIAVAAFGEDHPEVALYRGFAGRTLWAAKRYEEAVRTLELSVAGHERSVGLEHPDLLEPLKALGRVYLDTGRATEAIPHLRRAVSVAEREDLDPKDRALAQSLLADALWAQGRDRALALRIKRLAVEVLRRHPAEHKRAADAQERAREWTEALRGAATQ